MQRLLTEATKQKINNGSPIGEPLFVCNGSNMIDGVSPSVATVFHEIALQRFSTNRGIQTAIFLAALATAAGCNREPVEKPDDSAALETNNEKSFAEQLADIRNETSTRIEIDQSTTTDEQILSIRASDNLTVLKLNSAVLSTSTLEHLAKTPTLTQIVLRDCPIDDDGLRALAKRESLRFLNLPNGTFTDASLHAIAELAELEMFRFHSEHVTDVGVNTLLKSDSLRFLHLIDVSVTDEIVDALIACTNLESLYIDGGSISDDGYTRIYEARRDLHIHIDQQHHDIDPSKHD